MPHTKTQIHADETIARLTAVIESAPMAIVMIDTSGEIVLVNAFTEKLFDYPRDALLGHSVEKLVPARYRDKHPHLRSNFFNAPAARSMGAGRELFAVRRDGSEFPVEIGLNPIETDDGLLVLSVIIDITERKRGEQALRNSEKRIRLIVESALDAVVTMNDEGLVTGWNPRAETTFGWRREEAIDRPLAELIIPEVYRDAHHKGLKLFLKTGEGPALNQRLEMSALHKSGREFPIELTISPLRVGDHFEFSAFIRDITERKRLESALQDINEELEQRVIKRTSELEHAVSALEKSNLELQQFAYVASHDLQSPLRSISGFVQLLQSEYKGRLDAQADDWIRRTVEAIKRMQTLIKDILTYSRVDAQSARFNEVDLVDVFNESVAAFQDTVDEHGDVIERGELPTVWGDRQQLVQLLLNLLSNGLKYRGKDAPRIHVSAERGDDEWVVSVKDNGIGIEPEYHEKIFEIFKRLHDQQSFSGTGIGLAVCRRVVSNHSGRIWVQSAPGAGSTFYFTVPDKRSDKE